VTDVGKQDSARFASPLLKEENRMKNKKTNTAFIAALLTVSIIGCLDLELLDDMKPIEDTASEAEPSGIGASAAEGSGPTGALPTPDPADSSAPIVMAAGCGPDEHLVGSFCIAEGPISVSFRFETDEPAVAEITGEGEMVSAVFSEDWATSHHLGVFGLSEGEVLLSLAVKDINDNVFSTDLPITVKGGIAVSVTEILADPDGPEPAQEFVEIVNYGDAPVDLSGWMIDDGGDLNGDLITEGTMLSAGKAAVIVGADYNPEEPGEPTLSADSLLIRLDSSIASNGLKNSDAETVELYDELGVLVSRYNGTAGAPREGVSTVRLAPGLPDGDAEAFAPEPGGGATPGRIDGPQ
jgi:hypothetical protein